MWMFHQSKRPSEVVAHSKMQILCSVSKWSLSFRFLPPKLRLHSCSPPYVPHYLFTASSIWSAEYYGKKYKWHWVPKHSTLTLHKMTCITGYIYNSNSGYEGVTPPLKTLLLANIFPHPINNRTQSKPILRHLNIPQPDTCTQINSTHYWWHHPL